MVAICGVVYSRGRSWISGCFMVGFDSGIQSARDAHAATIALAFYSLRKWKNRSEEHRY